MTAARIIIPFDYDSLGLFADSMFNVMLYSIVNEDLHLRSELLEIVRCDLEEDGYEQDYIEKVVGDVDNISNGCYHILCHHITPHIPQLLDSDHWEHEALDCKSTIITYFRDIEGH